MRRIVTASIAGVVSAVGLTVAAQDRDTLWTRVSAISGVVTLSWDDSHPWDAELRSRGAVLVARYFTDSRREVSQVIGTMTLRRAGDRALNVSLPDNVTTTPIGPVCLFIQLPDRRVVPIRRANMQGGDTAGFRYEEWERQVRQRGHVVAVQARVVTVERALSISMASVVNQERTVSGRGWRMAESCERITSPPPDVGAMPYDVVPLAEHDDVARRVCVYRISYGRELFNAIVKRNVTPLIAKKDARQARAMLRDLYDIAYVAPEAAGPLLAELKTVRTGNQPVLAARATQAVEFLRDWNRFSPHLAGYTPHLGTPDDYLQWPSAAAEGAFRIFGRDTVRQLDALWVMDGVPAPTVSDLEGVLGTSMDAYFGCVEDGRKQLQTKLESWETLVSSAPQRAAAARDFLVRECRQETTLLDKLKLERSTLEQQLLREQEALKAAMASSGALSARTEVLNTVSCVQP